MFHIKHKSLVADGYSALEKSDNDFKNLRDAFLFTKGYKKDDKFVYPNVKKRKEVDVSSVYAKYSCDGSIKFKMFLNSGQCVDVNRWNDVHNGC